MQSLPASHGQSWVTGDLSDAQMKTLLREMYAKHVSRGAARDDLVALLSDLAAAQPQMARVEFTGLCTAPLAAQVCLPRPSPATSLHARRRRAAHTTTRVAALGGWS